MIKNITPMPKSRKRIKTRSHRPRRLPYTQNTSHRHKGLVPQPPIGHLLAEKPKFYRGNLNRSFRFQHRCTRRRHGIAPRSSSRTLASYPLSLTNWKSFKRHGFDQKSFKRHWFDQNILT